MIGEDEYKTETTLPAFATKELEPLGMRCTFVIADPKSPHDFPGVEALDDADLLVLSVRRRAPTAAQMAIIRNYIEAGKPRRRHPHGLPCLRHARQSTRGTRRMDDVRSRRPRAAITRGITAIRSCRRSIGPRATSRIRSSRESRRRSPARVRCTRSARWRPGAVPLLSGKIPGHPSEPVAWINAQRPVAGFLHVARSSRRFRNARVPQAAPQRGVLGTRSAAFAGRRPRESAGATTIATETDAPFDRGQGPLRPARPWRSFKVPDDLQLDLVLSEPIVRQPVSIYFDERGRLWVVQYLQYPYPAGLKMVSHDGVWRAVYDKVPPPPPHHFRGKDKITIHEDTDGDGIFDRHKTFVDGLNIATAVARGRGGVWVLNPPYLLFYPDRNNDDVPDGDPEVHLQGFGLEDTHSVVNSLRWGPDGWLYAAQGSTVTGHVTRPGLDAGRSPCTRWAS